MLENAPGYGLILTESVIVGSQIASLLNACGWRTQVIHSDIQAYNIMVQEKVDAVIADIDDAAPGGLAVLVLCRHHSPPITSYAVCKDGNSPSMQPALGLDCSGYFYLKQGKAPQLDTSRGLAVHLSSPASEECKPLPRRMGNVR